MRRLLLLGSRLCLLAALALPALALVPPIQHPFLVPKSLVWEPLAFLAAALALAAHPSFGPAPARVLWPRRALALGWSVLLGAGLVWVWNARLQQDLFHWHWTTPAFWEGWLRAVQGLVCAQMMAWSLEAGAGTAAFPLPRLALGLAALWSLAAAFSARPDTAFPDLPDWIAYLMAAFAAWEAGREVDGRRRVVAVVLAAAAANAAYGLCQSLGWDPLSSLSAALGHGPLAWAETFHGRAAGFFGNPDYLGGHLALALPLALGLALDPTRTRPGRALGWALVWTLAAALVATQTRGAWIAGLAGCAAALAATAWADRGALKAARTALIVTSAVLACGVAAWWTLAASPEAQGRVTGVLSGDQETGRRFFLMKKTSQLALRHPLLGVGPGNFRLQFPSVETQGEDPQTVAQQPYILSEHGHNDFLQMAADAGVPAALLWAALLGATFFLLLRGLPGAGPGLPLAAGAVGGLAAVAVHGLANFPFLILATQGSAWVVVALALRAEAREPDPADPADQRAWDGRPLAVGCALAGVLLVARGRQLAEDGWWWYGAGELGMNHADVASPLLLKATGMDRKEDRLWLLHGQAEFIRGNIWNSIGSLREAHALSPYDGEVAVRLGLSLIENRLYDEAWTVLSGAAKTTPNFPDVWEPLAAASFESGKFEDAVQAYDWMLFYHVHEEAAFTNKAAALGNLGRLPDALATLREAERRFPDSGKVQLNLAITLYKLGLHHDAHVCWQKAALLSPSDPQVDALREAMRP